MARKTFPEPLPRPSSRFIALDTASRAAASCIGIVRNCGKLPGDIGSQLSRAAVSVALNLAEGNGRKGKDRLYHFRVAYASANEATTALRILVGCGIVDPSAAAQPLDLLDQVRAMTWRLMGGVG